MSRTVLNYIPVKINQVNFFKFQGKDCLRNKRELPFDDFISYKITFILILMNFQGILITNFYTSCNRPILKYGSNVFSLDFHSDLEADSQSLKISFG